MSPTTTPQSKLILCMSASLDGFLAREVGVIDWLADPDAPVDSGAARHTANLELLGRAREIVLGRGAYDEMAEVWSNTDSPMGRLMNSLPKLVFSHSEPEFRVGELASLGTAAGGGDRRVEAGRGKRCRLHRRRPTCPFAGPRASDRRVPPDCPPGRPR